MNGFSCSHHVTLCYTVLHCMMPTCTWMGSATAIMLHCVKLCYTVWCPPVHEWVQLQSLPLSDLSIIATSEEQDGYLAGCVCVLDKADQINLLLYKLNWTVLMIINKKSKRKYKRLQLPLSSGAEPAGEDLPPGLGEAQCSECACGHSYHTNIYGGLGACLPERFWVSWEAICWLLRLFCVIARLNYFDLHLFGWNPPPLTESNPGI